MNHKLPREEVVRHLQAAITMLEKSKVGDEKWGTSFQINGRPAHEKMAEQYVKYEKVMGAIPQYLLQLERHISDDESSGTDGLQSSIAVHNVIGEFASKMFMHLDEAGEIRALNALLSHNGDFKQQLVDAGGRIPELISYPGGRTRVFEIGNRDLYTDIKSAINTGVKDIFAMANMNTAGMSPPDEERVNIVKAMLEGSQLDRNSPFESPSYAVDFAARQLVDAVALMARDSKKKFDASDIQDLEKLIKDYAQANVSDMVIACIGSEEVGADGQIRRNGQVVDPNTPINVAGMKAGTLLATGENRDKNAARTKLQEFLHSKGIKQENLNFPDFTAAGRDVAGRGSFGAMLGEVSRGYFAGWLNVNKGALVMLNPAKLERMCPSATGNGWNDRKAELASISPHNGSVSSTELRLMEQRDTFNNNKTKLTHNRPVGMEEEITAQKDAKGSGGGGGALNPWRAYARLFAKHMEDLQKRMGRASGLARAFEAAAYHQQKEGKASKGLTENCAIILKTICTLNGRIVRLFTMMWDLTEGLWVLAS